MSRLHFDRSLEEVHGSVDPSKNKSKWRRIAAFFGPAYLISVGYMDPGNWATDLAGGSQFGYTLIWVLVMSNLMALLLQSLSSRLGIVRGKDLAQCNRATYPKWLNFILYILAEIAIAATDLAEVLGMAVGLELLLGIPMLWGVGITFLDTLLLLYLQKLGMRKMEAFIIALVAIIGVCFLTELILARPDMAAIARGFVPEIPNNTALYIAIGIIGATVMPHNLYLHSALVQTRKIGRDEQSIRKAIKLNFWDSAIALNAAFFVNAAILILAAAVFYKSGNQQVAGLHDAHELLAPLLGSKWASHLFAIALIAAGQSSTVTGTLAGQIVMEGYLRIRINPWARRLLTRLIAIVPAVLIIFYLGEGEVDNMLVFSQVLLSMQLAFAVIPMIHFVSDRKTMGKFAINKITKTAAWIVAGLIVVLNLKLVYETVLEWMEAVEASWIQGLILMGGMAVVALLVVTIIYPLKPVKRKRTLHIHSAGIIESLQELPNQHFKKIALALDFTTADKKVIEYALRLITPQTELILIHIVESASAKLIGQETEDYETRKDWKMLEDYVAFFQSQGVESFPFLGYRNRSSEIAKIVKEQEADLLIMGSHGHKGLKDLMLGETVDQVRHLLNIPVFIAK